MRRLLAFTAFLSLLGVTVVAAANVSVNSEDVASFSTPVSIAPPAVAHIFHLKGAPGTLPGVLDPVAPTSNDSVQQKTIELDALGVGSQTNTTRYHSWETPVATGGGLVLSGHATLSISQNGNTNRITAGLFDCPDGAPASSIGCTLFAAGTNPGNEGSGFKTRVVDFGTLPLTVIPSGNRLRLKVVNQTGVSAANWELQWGFNPARPAELQITP